MLPVINTRFPAKRQGALADKLNVKAVKILPLVVLEQEPVNTVRSFYTDPRPPGPTHSDP